MSQLATPQSPFYTDANPLGLPDVPRFSGYPVPPQHPLTQYQKDQKNADPSVGLLGGAWEATTFNPTAYVQRLLRRVGRGMVADYDPEFMVTDDLVKQYGEGLQPEYQAKLYGATSLDDMMEMRDQYMGLQESQRKVGAGSRPIASSLLAGITDPIYLASGVATGGATTSLGAAMGGSTLARIAASGIINTGVAIPIETFKASQEPTQDLSASLIDGMIGTLAIEIGGRGLGRAYGGSRKLLGLARKDVEFAQAMDAARTARQMIEADPNAFANDPEFKAIVDTANLKDADRELLVKKILTPKGPEYFASQLDPEAPMRFVDQYIEESTLDPVADAEQIAALRGMANTIWDMQFRPPTAEPPNLGNLDGGTEAVGAVEARETAVPPAEMEAMPRTEIVDIDAEIGGIVGGIESDEAIAANIGAKSKLDTKSLSATLAKSIMSDGSFNPKSDMDKVFAAIKERYGLSDRAIKRIVNRVRGDAAAARLKSIPVDEAKVAKDRAFKTIEEMAAKEADAALLPTTKPAPRDAAVKSKPSQNIRPEMIENILDEYGAVPKDATVEGASTRSTRHAYTPSGESLNIPPNVVRPFAHALSPDEANLHGYTIDPTTADLGPMDLEGAVYAADALNAENPKAHYVVVQASADGNKWMVGIRDNLRKHEALQAKAGMSPVEGGVPSETRLSRIRAYAEKLEKEAKEGIASSMDAIKSGKIGIVDQRSKLVADIVQLAVARAIKLGAQTAEEIARIVKQIIGENYQLGEDMHDEVVKQVEAALPEARKAAEAEAVKGATVKPPDNRPAKRAEDFFPSASDDRPGMTGARISRIGSFGRSPSETTNRVLNVALADPLAKVDPNTGAIKASRTAGDEWRMVSETRESVAFQNTYNRALAEHMQKHPAKVKDRARAEQAFRELLYDVHIGAKASEDPNVLKIVAATRKQAQRILESKHRHGVDLDITHDDKHLPRFYNVPGINALLSKFSWVDHAGAKWINGSGQRFSQLAKLIGGALKEVDGKAKLTPERRQELGEMMLRQFLKTDLPASQRSFKITEGLLNEMEAKLRESGKLTEMEIRDALYVASGEGAKTMQGVNPNMRKARIDFDQAFTMELLNTETGKMEKVGITDLFDKDYEKVVSHMIHEGVSSSQEKAMLEELSRSGGRNYTKFSEVLDDIQIELHAKNVSNAGIKSEISKLQRAWDLSLGRPGNPDSGWAQFWRAVRGVSNIVGSASFGIAQLPQLGRAAATAQLRVMLKEMPDMAGLLRQFKSGNVSDEFIRWLDTITAADMDSMTQTWLQRIDDRNNDLWHRVNSNIDRASGWVRNISGVEPVNRAIRRMAAAGAVNRWIDAAMSGKIPNAARLGQMGLDAHDAAAIMAAITKDLGGSFEGPLKAKAMRLNLDNWEPELAARFMSAINKWAQNAADRPTIGSGSDWMDRTVGKVLTQWRTFTLQGWEKQTLAAVQARDFEAMAGVSYMTMIGSLTYMAQHYLRSVTMPREEQRDYRERYLTVDRIAAAAWSRNAFSSLTPMLYDTAQMVTGGQPIFAYSNAQATPADIWFGNPTTQRANALLNAALPRTIGAARDVASEALGDGTLTGKMVAARPGMEDLDRRAAKAWFQFAPARTAIGIQNFYDFLERQLPDPD